jgi:hypothetical protein
MPEKRATTAAKKATKQAEAEAGVLAKISARPAPWRAMGERLHALIVRSAPALEPRTWYGMPGYAIEGKTVCFFRADKKWMTFGFTQDANLTVHDGAPHQLIACAWLFTALDDATEATLAGLVRKVAH